MKVAGKRYLVKRHTDSNLQFFFGVILLCIFKNRVFAHEQTHLSSIKITQYPQIANTCQFTFVTMGGTRQHHVI